LHPAMDKPAARFIAGLDAAGLDAPLSHVPGSF
jgi:hypothetical protein